MDQLPGGFKGNHRGGEIEELRGGDLPGAPAAADCEAIRWITPGHHGGLVSLRGWQRMPGGLILWGNRGTTAEDQREFSDYFGGCGVTRNRTLAAWNEFPC